MKVWAWDDKRKKFRLVDENQLKLAENSHLPGFCKYITKRGWYYVYIGRTKKECWLNATRYYREEIHDLEENLAHKKAYIVKTYGEEPE